MNKAKAEFQASLSMDPESAAAHWGMRQVSRDLGDEAAEAHHTKLHTKYKPDENARDTAVSNARERYPAANHAAERVVIYDLHRAGAPELLAVTPEMSAAVFEVEEEGSKSQ